MSRSELDLNPVQHITSDAIGQPGQRVFYLQGWRETDIQPVVFNNMAGVWRATSTDGVSWSVNFNGTRDLKWNNLAPDAGEHLGLLTGTDVAMKLTGRYMPSGFLLPNHSGTQAGVMTLNLATRDAP